MFKNVLLVRKTPKYLRLKDTEVIEHPYIRDVLLQNWIDATQTHFEICEKFEETTRSIVDNLTVVQEWPLTNEDTLDKTLVISLGGDGTYLRTSSMIDNNNLPLLGINTDPGRSLGILCSKFLYKERSSPKHIQKIFSQIEQQQFTWMHRQRMNCRITPNAKSAQDRHEINRLMLNEVFIAEKNASKVSSYKLNVDEINLGRFKSSGIIISTGTGSSGWLYGAKRVTQNTVGEIARELMKISDKRTEECENIQQLRN